MEVLLHLDVSDAAHRLALLCIVALIPYIEELSIKSLSCNPCYARCLEVV